MVFVWSNLVEGEPHFTLSQVALNDTIMVVAFAPIVALLLGLSSITVSWNTLLLSVILYIVVPVIVAQFWRHMLLAKGGQAALTRALRSLFPVLLSALLLTLVRGEQIMRQPLVIALLAVPILIQVYFNTGLAYWLNRRLGVAWCVAGPSALRSEPATFLNWPSQRRLPFSASSRAPRFQRSSACWSKYR